MALARGRRGADIGALVHPYWSIIVEKTAALKGGGGRRTVNKAQGKSPRWNVMSQRVGRMRSIWQADRMAAISLLFIRSLYAWVFASALVARG